MSANHVTIAPGQVSVSLELRRTTALAGCTHLDADDEGRTLFVKDWPRLSSGEEILWRVLAWLSGEGTLPTDLDLDAGLDVVNAAAVRAALRAEGVVVA